MSKLEKLVNAVDWEYAGRRVAAAILIAGMLFLLFQLTLANLRIGS